MRVCAIFLTKRKGNVYNGRLIGVHMRVPLCVYDILVLCVCVYVQGGGAGVDIYVKCSEFNISLRIALYKKYLLLLSL